MSLFWPDSLKRREILLSLLAISLAIGSIFLCRSAGFAVGGAWSLCTIIGTLILIIFGRRQRVYLTAVFSLVFYICLGVDVFWTKFKLRGKLPAPSVEHAFAFLILFLIGVAFPVALAWLVTRFFGDKNTPPNHCAR